MAQKLEFRDGKMVASEVQAASSGSQRTETTTFTPITGKRLEALVAFLKQDGVDLVGKGKRGRGVNVLVQGLVDRYIEARQNPPKK